MRAQAAGWLAVLLPTQQVKEGMADWNAWLHDWMAIWAAQPNDNFLGMCIMGLVSRVARNDTQCKSLQFLDIVSPHALQIRSDKWLPDWHGLQNADAWHF